VLVFAKGGGSYCTVGRQLKVAILINSYCNICFGGHCLMAVSFFPFLLVGSFEGIFSVEF
jgi:hypothetical protein